MSKEVVASFNSYSSAEKAVDSLSDAGFPVENASIVGSGLRFIENVTGRTTFWRRVGEGAFAGAWIGIFIGLLFSLLQWYSTVVSLFAWVITGILAGAVAGAVIAAVGHLALGGRRDFSSSNSVEAERYDLLVDSAHADRARQVLGEQAVVDLTSEKSEPGSRVV